MAEDCSGYRTVNSTQNLTHYLNFSDSSSTGVGAIQKTDGIRVNPNTNTLTLTDGVNSLVLTPTTNLGNATTITTTSDNTNTTCYIVFSKTTAGANTALYLDDITGPLTYNPVSGALGTSIVNCNRYDATTTTSAGNVFNNVVSGNTTYSNSSTTGSVSIASLAQTTGSVNIGSTTATTGVCSIRPPLVLSRQLRTTNNSVYSPSNVLDLGYTNQVFGSSFNTTILLANTITTLETFSFTSANYGTYQFYGQAEIIPTDLTAERSIELSISTPTATIQPPYYSKVYTSVNGSIPTISITRTIQIYADTTIYLTARCSFGANVNTIGGDGLFSYTRIA
jgi:hypothetical protein